MLLRDFMQVCREPVIVEKFDECGNGERIYIQSAQEIIVNSAVALYTGEEYALNGYEEVDFIWHDDGFLTVTLKEPEEYDG